jgi:hypothetical protein
MRSPWFTTEEAGPYTRTAVSTLEKKRVYGGGPKFSKRGRMVFYHIDDLDAWMRECVVSSTSELKAAA